MCVCVYMCVCMCVCVQCVRTVLAKHRRHDTRPPLLQHMGTALHLNIRGMACTGCERSILRALESVQVHTYTFKTNMHLAFFYEFFCIFFMNFFLHFLCIFLYIFVYVCVGCYECARVP